MALSDEELEGAIRALPVRKVLQLFFRGLRRQDAQIQTVAKRRRFMDTTQARACSTHPDNMTAADKYAAAQHEVDSLIQQQALPHAGLPDVTGRIRNMTRLACQLKREAEDAGEVHTEDEADFSAAFSPTVVTIVQGGKDSVTLNISNIGKFTGPIEVLIDDDLPAGITVPDQFEKVSAADPAVFEVAVDAGAAPGSYAVPYEAEAIEQGIAHSLTLTVIVTAAVEHNANATPVQEVPEPIAEAEPVAVEVPVTEEPFQEQEPQHQEELQQQQS